MRADEARIAVLSLNLRREIAGEPSGFIRQGGRDLLPCKTLSSFQVSAAEIRLVEDSLVKAYPVQVHLTQARRPAEVCVTKNSPFEDCVVEFRLHQFCVS